MASTLLQVDIQSFGICQSILYLVWPLTTHLTIPNPCRCSVVLGLFWGVYCPREEQNLTAVCTEIGSANLSSAEEDEGRLVETLVVSGGLPAPVKNSECREGHPWRRAEPSVASLQPSELGLFHAVHFLVLWKQKPEYVGIIGMTATARTDALTFILNTK